ncbi:MAG: hypothetical protein ABI782_07430 [Anaerolineaceae bacterium]
MENVTLRDEQQGHDRRALWAHVDDAGAHHIDGQDLGPGTASVSSDGEYEWFRTFSAAHLPQVIELLDGRPGEDPLDVPERWIGRSYELERRLRESTRPSELFVT